MLLDGKTYGFPYKARKRAWDFLRGEVSSISTSGFLVFAELPEKEANGAIV